MCLRLRFEAWPARVERECFGLKISGLGFRLGGSRLGTFLGDEVLGWGCEGEGLGLKEYGFRYKGNCVVLRV